MIKWVAMHALARHKLLPRYYGKFKADFFRQRFTELRGDHRRWNLLWATRILLILEPIAKPHVMQRLSEVRLDDQERTVLK